MRITILSNEPLKLEELNQALDYIQYNVKWPSKGCECAELSTTTFSVAIEYS